LKLEKKQKKEKHMNIKKQKQNFKTGKTGNTINGKQIEIQKGKNISGKNKSKQKETKGRTM